MNVEKLEFEIKGDERGSLIAIEQLKDVPFEIKRAYFIYDTKNDIARGFHAHKNLEQVLICVNGRCSIKVDNVKNQKIIELDKPNQGLHISKNIWREMFNFSEDCVLLVLASEYYDKNEYIYDYDEFRTHIDL